MTTVDDSVLKPGTGIDLVINLHSLSPTSRSSVIFEADQKRKTLLIASPDNGFDVREAKKKTLHISTLVREESGEKRRIGFPCRIVKVHETYRLANGNTTQALTIAYKPVPEEVNVRNAFRYIPSATHEVLGKMVIANHDFFSGTDFRISDISLTGVGLMIPKEIEKQKNPLTALENGRIAKLALVLRDHSQEKEQIETIDTTIRVIRVNRRFNELGIFVGCLFTRIPMASEETLSQFIHKAQLHEIRSITHA